MFKSFVVRLLPRPCSSFAGQKPDFSLSVFLHLMAEKVNLGEDEYLTIAVTGFAAGSFRTSGLAAQKSTKWAAASIVPEFDSAMNDVGFDPSIWLSSSTLG